ncbi:hypothetical protein [Lichenibacterium dinghuense]|uniref:hypothetical protein n=1 Tax=Lichenibacterium dinghuense TaxID=2895977 RepID=UPI001F40BD27|nr:hypothetical protein [Lichenibacterium sp. 6Y81]
MSDAEKRWLPVVRTAMRDVDPADYIYSPNQAPPGRRPPRDGLGRAVLLVSTCVLLTLLLSFAAASWAGYRRVSLEDERALRVVHAIDPEHEVSTDEELSRRWGLLAEAFRIVRTAVASPPNGQEYPYLATLAGTPSPAVSPGSGPAIVLLANALDLYPPAVRGRMIQRLLAVAASMDQWGVTEALIQLARLTTPVRDRLFADQAVSFRHLVDLAGAAADGRAVVRKLEAELREVEERRAIVQRRLEDAVKDTAEAEQACARPIRNAQACLAHMSPSSPR